MKIRILNETGNGQDTKIILVLKNSALGPTELNISECFYNSKIEIPANGEVKADLSVDRARLDLIIENPFFRPIVTK